jgi:GTP-binding protein
LKNYSPKILKKKELIVLNKIDLIESDKVKKIIKDFSRNTKSEIIALSTFEKKSVSKIKAKLISYVS